MTRQENRFWFWRCKQWENNNSINVLWFPISLVENNNNMIASVLWYNDCMIMSHPIIIIIKSRRPVWSPCPNVNVTMSKLKKYNNKKLAQRHTLCSLVLCTCMYMNTTVTYMDCILVYSNTDVRWIALHACLYKVNLGLKRAKNSCKPGWRVLMCMQCISNSSNIQGGLQWRALV